MMIKSDIHVKNELEKISIRQIEKDLKIDSVWKNLIHVDRSIIYTPEKI